jgi:UDP-glucose 4-epimerase
MAERYLITGGAGFIGSHLAELLVGRGDEVVVLDDLSTGRMSNLDAVIANRNLQVVVGSVLDEVMVDELTHRCDAVIHLAAAVGVELILERPLRSFTTNVRGSEIVIGAAHRYRRRVLIASTSEIYGKNGVDELFEDANRILGPTSTTRWWYSTAKAVDEILALAYHQERGLPATIVRLFNTVGPRQSPHYGMVIPRLVRQALNGESVTVFGDGHQSRCFCHVRDVVDAICRLIDSPDTIGEVYNVGTREETTIIGLAQRVIELSGSSSEIELIPYDKAYGDGFEDMRRRVPNTGKLQRATGWTATHSLDEILVETIADAARELAEPDAESS